MARSFVRDEHGDVFQFSRHQETKAFLAVELIVNRDEIAVTVQRYRDKVSGLVGWAIELNTPGREVAAAEIASALTLCRTAASG